MIVNTEQILIKRQLKTFHNIFDWMNRSVEQNSSCTERKSVIVHNGNIQHRN